MGSSVDKRDYLNRFFVVISGVNLLDKHDRTMGNLT